MALNFYFPPVSGVEIYANDLVVRRAKKGHVGGKRTKVKMLSQASLRRLAFVASNTQAEFRTMITLTYPSNFPTNGVTVKGHLRRLLDKTQAEWGDYDYLWFLEFQKRGAPHIHILTTVGFNREQMRYEQFYVSALWYLTVDSGDSKHLAAGTRFENLRSANGGRHYAVSYARKPRQKLVPSDFLDVGRFWGYSPSVKPRAIALVPLKEAELRQILADWEYLPKNELPKVLYNTAGRYAPLLLDRHFTNLAKQELDYEYWQALNREIGFRNV